MCHLHKLKPEVLLQMEAAVGRSDDFSQGGGETVLCEIADRSISSSTHGSAVL